MNSIAKLLNEEFENRKLKNRRYSLRAFARSLGLEPSVLSKVLRGERILGRKSLERIAKRLDVPGETLRSMRLGSAILGPVDGELQPRGDGGFPFEIHPIDLILIEALKIPAFAEDTRRLREYLKMDSGKFEKCLENLEQIGFITRHPELGNFAVKRKKAGSFQAFLSNRENMQLLRDFFYLARERLVSEISPNQVFTNLTLALSSRQFEMIQDLLAKLLWRINMEANKSTNQDGEVYNFTLAFYPAVKSTAR